MTNANWMRFKLTKKLVNEVLKFGIVGAINTGVDLVVLKSLIALTGRGDSGAFFVLFKGVSFIFAAVNSYYMNKYWTFNVRAGKRRAVEVQQFIFITGIGWFINVVSASVFLSYARQHFSFSSDRSVTISALFGTLVGLLWNFFGYKILVFRHKQDEVLPPL